jgi:hypothetical protein
MAISTTLVFLSPYSRQVSGVEGVMVIYGHSEPCPELVSWVVSESQTLSCSNEVENYLIFLLPLRERVRAYPVLGTGVRGM